MLRILCLLLLSAIPAFGQSSTPTVTVATLNDLLARAPRDNESALVLRGYNGQDWGDGRVFTQTTSSALATNVAHVFAITNIYGAQGQWLSSDRTNSVQDIRWWRGGPQAADNTAPLTNAANYVSNLGGGYVKAGAGTHTFLSGGINMPSGVRFIGAGADATVFDFTAATPAYDYEPVISWVGTVDNTVKLHSVPTVGDRSIVLSSSVSWANGDWIQLSDTNAFSFGSRNYYKQGEFNFVYSNDGGTNIALVEPLEAAYPTATTTINKITPTVGSAEGVHFALGTKSGSVLLRYADSRSFFRNCSGAGTEEAHFWIDSSYGVTADGITVDWDSDPAVGLNYGMVFGDSEYLVVQNCFLRSARHGISSGGSSIPTRYCRVINSTLGSTRQNVPGADLHEDTVETTFDNCTFLSGVSLGGGRNRVLNSTLSNGYDYPAIATSSCYYFDWEIRGNRFLLSSFDASAQSVWAMRFFLGAGSQSGQPASTNYWPGTWGGTAGQTIKIIDNEIQFTGVRTNSNFGIYIDEASTLTSNTNITAAEFGGVIITGNRIIPSPDQPFAQDESSGIYIYTRDKVRFRNVIIENNPLLHSASPAVRVHTGNVSIRNNTFRDLLNKDGALVLPPVAGSVYGTLDVDISDNLFDRPIGSAAVVVGTQGRVVMRRNRVINHGLINVSISRYALAAYDGSDPISSAELYDNFVSSTNSPSYDVYISTAAGTLRDERTQIGGSVTAGTRSAGGGYLRAPYSLSNFGATNAWTAVGQFAAAPASPFPGIGLIASEPWFYDGAAFDRLRGWGDTNFANIYVTNTITAGALVESPLMTTTTNLSQTLWATNAQAHFLLGRTLSIADAWPVPNNAVPSTYPLYVFASTNAFSRTSINNYSTGASAGTGLQLFSSGGAFGWLAAWGTNNASGNVKARLQMRADEGAGMAFDLAYPNSQDLIYTYGGGTEFARLNTSTFSLPGLTTLAPTNVPTHVAIFDTDPTSTRRLLKSMTLADLKNAMGATSFAGFKTGDGTNDMVGITNLILRGDGANIVQMAMGTGTEPTAQFTASIRPNSLTTNYIDSTFYSLLMMTNTGGGSTTTNRLVKSLYQNGSSLTIAAAELSEKSVMTNAPNWAVTNFASGYWTTDKALHVEASGTFTAAADWSGNVIRVKLGSYVLSYTFDEPDSTTPTDAAWRIVADIQVSATGTNATVAGVGSLIYYQGTAATMLQSGVIAAVPSGTLDTTVQNTLSVTYDNDGTQPLTFKVHSLFAEEKGAEILTSGGSGSSSPASLVSVNGTTNNWNFNNTTPAAPAATTVARLQTTSTNALLVVDVAPTIASISRQAWSNTTAYVVIASGTLTPTNMPYDGAMLRGTVGGVWAQQSGTAAGLKPKFVINGTAAYDSAGIGTVVSGPSVRAWRIDFEIFRVATNNFSGGFQHVVSGSGTPSAGYGSIANAATISTRPAIFADIAGDISTNVTWELQLATDVANATNIITTMYGGVK